MKKIILSTLSIICLILMFIIILNKEYQTERFLKVLMILTVLLFGLTILNTSKKRIR